MAAETFLRRQAGKIPAERSGVCRQTLATILGDPATRGVANLRKVLFSNK